MVGQIFQPVQNSSSPVWTKLLTLDLVTQFFCFIWKKYLALTSTALIHGKPFISFLRLISTVKKVAYRLLATTKLMSTLMTVGMVKVLFWYHIYVPCIFALQWNQDLSNLWYWLFSQHFVHFDDYILIVFLKKKCSSLIYARIFITSTVPI